MQKPTFAAVRAGLTETLLRMPTFAAVMGVLAILVLLRGGSANAANPPSRADQPPRKVVVGTTIFWPGGAYPGLEARLQQLGTLVDELAAEAAAQFPGRGLDLAVLTEGAVTPASGSAEERAAPLEGPIQDRFSSLARKHHCYLVVPLDLREAGPNHPRFVNAAVLFDRQGEVAGIYRKVHPVAWVGRSSLEGGITPGSDFPVFDCDFGKLGIQICWDLAFEDGWDALAKKGAEIVAWPSASPATVLPASRAARHRFYIVGSNWRDNATVYEPTGMVAARIEEPHRTLVCELDLSHAILGWSVSLRDGQALSEKYGDRVGYHYSPREDLGLFWSNDPTMTIGAMIRSIGAEELDHQIERNRQLQNQARGGAGR